MCSMCPQASTSIHNLIINSKYDRCTIGHGRAGHAPYFSKSLDCWKFQCLFYEKFQTFAVGKKKGPEFYQKIFELGPLYSTGAMMPLGHSMTYDFKNFPWVELPDSLNVSFPQRQCQLLHTGEGDFGCYPRGYLLPFYTGVRVYIWGLRYCNKIIFGVGGLKLRKNSIYGA